MRIGLRGMKLSRSTVNVGEKKGTSMPMKYALDEAFEDENGLRKSLTDSYDSARTHFNEYFLPDGVRTGKDLADFIEEKFQARNAERANEFVTFVPKSGPAAGTEVRRRKRPMSDKTNPAITFVLAPALEDTQGMDREEKLDLARSMISSLEAAMQHSILAYAVHFDEGTRDEHGHYSGFHVHAVMMTDNPETKDFGTTKMWTPATMRNIHKIFPQEMKKRGYLVDPDRKSVV